MTTRRNWWFWEMRVAPPCGWGQLCGLRRPPPPLPQGGWRAFTRAAGWGQVAGGARPQPGGLLGPFSQRRCVGEAWSCEVCLLGSAELGSCNVGGRAASASAGGNSLRGLHSGVRGLGSGVAGLCVGGMCGSLGGMGVPWGVGMLAAGVCGLVPARLAGRGGLWGVSGRSGGRGGPVLRDLGFCVSVGAGEPLVGEWGWRGRGCGDGFACSVPMYVFAFRGAFVWSRLGREG